MIVITGASDGLGKELAKIYKEAGKRVVNVSRTKSEFADDNILLSLREGPEIQNAADALMAIDEKIEAIVHCAGVLSVEPLGEITENEIKRLMSTNVKSQILLTSMLVEKIKKDETDIVLVSSTSGTKGDPNFAVYGASKWAVRGFAKNLQAEFESLPNRVISFCPGAFSSRIFDKAERKVGSKKSGNFMNPNDLALLIKQILDMPKIVEVSEIIINRKKAAQ